MAAEGNHEHSCSHEQSSPIPTVLFVVFLLSFRSRLDRQPSRALQPRHRFRGHHDHSGSDHRAGAWPARRLAASLPTAGARPVWPARPQALRHSGRSFRKPDRVVLGLSGSRARPKPGPGRFESRARPGRDAQTKAQYISSSLGSSLNTALRLAWPQRVSRQSGQAPARPRTLRHSGRPRRPHLASAAARARALPAERRTGLGQTENRAEMKAVPGRNPVRAPARPNSTHNER